MHHTMHESISVTTFRTFSPSQDGDETRESVKKGTRKRKGTATAVLAACAASSLDGEEGGGMEGDKLRAQGRVRDEGICRT